MVDTDDTRRTTDDGCRTTRRVWHKLPTGELKITENVNKPSKRQEFDLYDRHVRFHGSSSVINCDRLWMPKQMLLR